MTSFDVIRKLRKILWTKKIGHTGTLDPLASWCLLIATGTSTKLIPMLEKLEKTYTFTVRIDGTSESLDLWTDITLFDIPSRELHSKESLITFLENQTSQIPPKYSALNINGVRAYELARKWHDVIIPARPIQIRNVRVCSFLPPEIEIQLRISSGGYIRSLAPTIGQFFWTPGGYISTLRRDAIHLSRSSLNLEEAQNIEWFDSTRDIPLSQLFWDIPLENVDEKTYTMIQEWRELPNDLLQKEWKVWQKYFIKYSDSPLSLIEYQENGFQIIRNNIEHSHKIYRE